MMRGVSIGIKRSGDCAKISLECDGDYHAIEVDDRLVEAAKRGEVLIELKTRSGPAPKTQ